MASGADEFRAEARQTPGHVAKRKIGGWSFCLTYGAVDPQEAARGLDAGSVRIEFDGEDKTEEVAQRLRATTPEKHAVAREIFAGEWMLSVKILPSGRVPAEKDLAFLGRTLVALHVPSDAAQPTMILGTRHWIWKDS